MTRETLNRYARAEQLSDAVVHMIGLACALAAVPVLVWLSVEWRGDVAVVTAVSIYGTTLVGMLGCSALYNMTREHRFTPVFRRLDHSAIYLKIAGSFTPLAAMTGGGGMAFLAGLWMVAIGGSSLKIIAPDRLRWLGLSLYLGMGWVGVWVGRDIIEGLTPGAVALIATAGVLYTVGVLFYLWERLPFHTAIWHGFVVIASGLIYAAMCVEVTRQLGPMPALG
ncbi:hemolysin III [Palleronia marisminoris]|uniref:Hemolysin-III related n=1 Tax=Palleronia marisminoris TaxID=315423 RepID=A0A1Y5SHB7_9RHOB|nr:hemolysin III family protein [Palleronia marisminoris]SFG82334.1 hemolysin III [Palleronia marisminoris]SLN40507.1 hemolysin-III related [Palleronia marisminoris]